MRGGGVMECGGERRSVNERLGGVMGCGVERRGLFRVRERKRDERRGVEGVLTCGVCVCE